MNTRLIYDIAPTAAFGRSSEGSFIRFGDEILFAYSRYNSADWNDHASCDIALIRSRDEGESWSEPVLIARAADYGTKNIMSVSAVKLAEGIAFFYLIKENDGSTTIGRAVSTDGVQFTPERCTLHAPRAYYVINNDRFERLSDGRIAAPAAYIPVEYNDVPGCIDYVSCVFASDDDGKTFRLTPARLAVDRKTCPNGLMEPGILELAPGMIWLWARTQAHCQYEAFSPDNLRSFTPAIPSQFTSPNSPMELYRLADGTLLTVYNPIPSYNGRVQSKVGWGRTPLVIRKSTDNGATWGPCNTIEDDPERGYCYPAMIETTDGCVIVSYCRGGSEDKACLCRLGMSKIELASIE